MNGLLIRNNDEYILQKIGSEVNELEQLFHPWGVTVTYWMFEMAWEVIEKQYGYEVSYR